MLPFAHMMAADGATFVGSVTYHRQNTGSPLSSKKVQIGDLLVAVNGKSSPGSGGGSPYGTSWVLLGSIVYLGAAMQFWYKLVTSADLQYTGPSSVDFSMLCYRDAAAAKLVSAQGFQRDPRHAGAISFGQFTTRTSPSGLVFREQGGGSGSQSDPRPVYSLFDLVLPQGGYVSGTPFLPSTGGDEAVVELLK